MEPTPAEEAPTKVPFLKGKRIPSAILAGGAAFAMILAGLGIANAQTDDGTPPTSTAPAEGGGEGEGRPFGRHHTHADHHPHARLSVAAEALGMTTADLRAELVAGTSIAQVAEAKGVDVQKVIDALVADATTVLNTAVENGRITREQADARIAELPERMTNFVNRTRPAGEGDGERRHKGPGGPGIGMKADAPKIAEALGMTAEELKAGHEAGKSLATMASEQGVDVQKVIDVLVADAEERLAQAVTDGKLTQAQADERSANLTARITEMVNRAPSADGERRKGPGHGPGMKANLEVAATALGITPEALRTELQAGKSLATIAGEKNVDVAKVVDALVADAKARLAQAVTDGKLTQAQADERSANLEARITDLVNRVGRPHDGHRPGPGAVAPVDGDAEAATLTA